MRPSKDAAGGGGSNGLNCEVGEIGNQHWGGGSLKAHPYSV